MAYKHRKKRKAESGADWNLSESERQKAIQWHIDNSVFTLDGKGRIWRIKERNHTAKLKVLDAAYLKPCEARLADIIQDKTGYRRVQINFAWRHFTIMAHRLVVSITRGEVIPRDFVVDHINSDRADNRPANLQVVEPKLNNDRMVWTKIMRVDSASEGEINAYLMRRMFYDSKHSLIDIAHRFGVDLTTARKVIHNEIFPDEETKVVFDKLEFLP